MCITMTDMHWVATIHLVVTVITQLIGAATPVTTVTSSRGHYPHTFCEMTNMVIDAEHHRISGNIRDKEQQQYLETYCGGVVQMFGVRNDPNPRTAECDVTFDKGFVFTIYYHYGSNYFHLHYDMMLPLFSWLRLLYTGGKLEKVALLPSVETSRLQIIDWSTPAFQKKSAYWMQMLQVLAGGAKLLPIEESLSKKFKTLCFQKIYFGTPGIKFTDKPLINSYISHVKETLQIQNVAPKEHCIGLIHRENRRKIENEDELIKAVRNANLAEIDLIEFSGMTFREQVLGVQKYSVLVGMNGAGLTNALYRPPGAVAVQLVPYNASVNFRMFGELLKSRGPYLEWHNLHQELSVEYEHDVFNSQSDTIVKTEEFLDLMKKALGLVGTNDQRVKSEL